MLTSKTTNTVTTKQNLEFPILVINKDGGIFYVTSYTNGKNSPCINPRETGEIPNLYTSQLINLSKPFPQDGYDLFNGSITLTQEINK